MSSLYLLYQIGFAQTKVVFSGPVAKKDTAIVYDCP